MTRQRALILGIMREKCPEHLTADEIFSHARQAMPHIARGTVYRNLKLMELDGEIGHLEMPDGPDRYDANPTPHGHLLCDSCGDLADLPVVGLILYWLWNGDHPQIRYICPKCRAKNAQ